ncbi:hypothetical protein IE81DRAFT_245868 [Ceraceosorus guamensis]|uniref:Uncharacterized protein n=1 Tax=Ceraceosorus guamensis TaxID=1522189 RepID=A0A316VR06_9BASI|nr:hypothetical protein IE81DRAFT_245868 [Ceraceosorus guamensis]PWN40047.1 hypothetical protein IE81DRAFT_245868 [Ceraceosorus guamensis]
MLVDSSSAAPHANYHQLKRSHPPPTPRIDARTAALSSRHQHSTNLLIAKACNPEYPNSRGLSSSEMACSAFMLLLLACMGV